MVWTLTRHSTAIQRVTWYIQHRSESILAGWMEKRGAINKSFRKRYFHLKFDRIEYFKGPLSTRARGRIVLEVGYCTSKIYRMG